jgi:hypothetical protein
MQFYFKMKMTVFWDVAPCTLVVTDVLEVRAASIIRVNFYHTTRRNIPEDSHLHTRRRENLKSHQFDFISNKYNGTTSSQFCIGSDIV